MSRTPFQQIAMVSQNSTCSQRVTLNASHAEQRGYLTRDFLSGWHLKRTCHLACEVTDNLPTGLLGTAPSALKFRILVQ